MNPIKFVPSESLTIKHSDFRLTLIQIARDLGSPRIRVTRAYQIVIFIPDSLNCSQLFPGISAGCLVNPPKTRHEVAEEGKCSRAMYKFTHGDYAPGEQICRKYVLSISGRIHSLYIPISLSSYVGGLFKRTNTFGMPTPNDWAGRQAKKVVDNWRTCCPDDPYVTKYYADHVDFRHPKLGLPQDAQCIKKMLGNG